MGKVVPEERARSHVSYYVLVGVLVGLLVLLCCYVCYFFITKIRELSDSDLPSATPPVSCPKKPPVSYPVQPVVRESATAMAALCRQLPAGPGLQGGQGGQVFPGARSPSPRPAHASPARDAAPRSGAAPDKLLAPAAAVPCITAEAVG